MGQPLGAVERLSQQPGVYGAHVCGVKGLHTQTLKASHVRQVGHASGGCKGIDKTGELAAIGAHDRAVGWVFLNKYLRHGLKKGLTHQLRNNGIAGGQRVDQSALHIVAIYRETAVNVAVVAGNACGGGRVWIEQCFTECFL